jgi:hypothetical protein
VGAAGELLAGAEAEGLAVGVREGVCESRHEEPVYAAERRAPRAETMSTMGQTRLFPRQRMVIDAALVESQRAARELNRYLQDQDTKAVLHIRAQHKRSHRTILIVMDRYSPAKAIRVGKAAATLRIDLSCANREREEKDHRCAHPLETCCSMRCRESSSMR